MTLVKRTEKRVGGRHGVTIAAAEPKPAAMLRGVEKKELNSFLALHVGEATDAYLRELALVAIQSRHLAHTVEQLSACLAEVEAAKGELIEDRYLVANDGTVTDQQTELMWMQSVLEGSFNFVQAQKAVKNLNSKSGFAGHRNWRLPTKDELESLVVVGIRPAICQEAFPDTPEVDFWTSSSPQNNRSISEQYFVDFGLGKTYRSYIDIEDTKILLMTVRLVRFSRNSV